MISKILIDAGLEKSSFARVILTAAVIEDGFLYIALSILLSQAKDLVHVMQIIAITILFFALNIKFGPGILRFVRGLR
ncbi:hypothetical protein, partial [Pseudomonas sp. FW305-E2]|uniref:hypothetical protein n=1 Tax=Pseudomonas sp. FW305-E2 TaxID=2075558 RepID=UPI001C477832